MPTPDANQALRTADDVPSGERAGADVTAAFAQAAPRGEAGRVPSRGTEPTGSEPERPLGADSVPGYHLEAVLGRGGMGVVYKARQKGLNRPVALKMILAGGHAGSTEVSRFRDEAESIARLHHPNIVQVYEIGECSTQPGGPPLPFISLEYLEGGSLSAHLDGAPQPARAAARFVQTLAEAMQFAHQHNVIHRDLKPANILLTADATPRGHETKSSRLSERSPDVPRFGLGTPKIADFGLAKRLDNQSGLTVSGTIVGTPTYMAPEQAAGRVTSIGPSADIYSLGVILYELLTGRPPFRGASSLDTLEQVRKQEPVPPRRLLPKLPRDLDTICLKCLQKDAAKRYATAQALADDLGRFLAGESILARPVGPVERTWRWCRRNPIVALSLASVFASLLLGFIVSVRFALLARAGEERAVNEAERANREKRLSDRRRYVAEFRWAWQKWRDGHLDEVQQILHELEPVGEDEDLRGFEWHYLQRLCQLDSRTLVGHDGDVFAVAFCPDGRQLASASIDGSVRIWDRVNGQLLHSLPGQAQVFCLAYSADGKQFATGGADGKMRIWDPATGARLLTLTEPKGPIKSVAFSPDGKLVAAGGNDRLVHLWDLSTHRTSVLAGHGKSVQSIAFSPDGQQLASAGSDHTVKLWDVARGQEQRSLTGHTGPVRCVTFSHDGRWLASASADKTIKIWDRRSWQVVRTPPGHTDEVRCVAFSPDDTRLVSASWDRTVRVWDRDTARELLILRGHSALVLSASFSPDGRLIASGGADRTVKLWDATESQEQTVLRRSNTSFLGVAFSPDRRWLVSTGMDGVVRIWDAVTSLEVKALTGFRGAIRCLAFSPEAQLLAVGGAGGAVQLWDTANWLPRGKWSADTEMIHCIAFSPDGQTLATGGANTPIILWDVRLRRPVRTLQGHTGTIASIAFSPTEPRLVSSGDDKTICLWDLDSGAAIRKFVCDQAISEGVAFSPDGRWLAGGPDGSLRSLVSGERRFALGNRPVSTYTVAFSPDGRRIVSAGEDLAVHLWDAATGQELLTLTGHTQAVRALAFSSTGLRLASAGLDGRMNVWEAMPLTAALREQREALSVIRFWSRRSPDHPAVAVEGIRHDARISEPVRRRAMALLDIVQGKPGPTPLP